VIYEVQVRQGRENRSKSSAGVRGLLSRGFLLSGLTPVNGPGFPPPLGETVLPLSRGRLKRTSSEMLGLDLYRNFKESIGKDFTYII
jgi:hypothetical protein